MHLPGIKCSGLSSDTVMLVKIDILTFYIIQRTGISSKNNNLSPCLGYSCQESFKASRYPQTFIEDDHGVFKFTVVVERLRLD